MSIEARSPGVVRPLDPQRHHPGPHRRARTLVPDVQQLAYALPGKHASSSASVHSFLDSGLRVLSVGC